MRRKHATAVVVRAVHGLACRARLSACLAQSSAMRKKEIAAHTFLACVSFRDVCRLTTDLVNVDAHAV